MLLRYAKKIIFRAARIGPLGFFVGKTFEHASALLPLKVRGQNRLAICFDHPVPYVPFHRLIIPKRRVATIFDLSAEVNADALTAALTLAGEVALALPDGAYFLSINAGCRQDVMQAHWHLTQVPLASDGKRTNYAMTGAETPSGARVADVLLALRQALEPQRRLAKSRGFTIALPLAVHAGNVRWGSACSVLSE